MGKKTIKADEFASMDGWREHYFPKESASTRIEELGENVEDLGVVLANDTFERHLNDTRPGRKK